MKTAWINHLSSDEDKERYTASLRNSRWILDRQTEILQSMERGLDRQEISPKAYDSPNWQYRQAHANGYRQAIRAVLELNNLDHKENYSDPTRELINELRQRPAPN